MAPTRTPALTATVGMIDGVHHDAAHFGTAPQPTRSSGLTYDYFAMIQIAHLSDGSTARLPYQSYFTGGQPQSGLSFSATHELHLSPGTAGHTRPLTRVQLDIVDGSANWNTGHRHCITDFDRSITTRHYRIPDTQTVDCNHVSLFTVAIGDQGDKCRAIRIVFDRCNPTGYADLISTKIDDAIAPFMPTTSTTHGNTASIIATTFFRQWSNQALLRRVRGDLVERVHRLEALGRR